MDEDVDCMVGFGMSPLTYPVSPLDPRICAIVTFHVIRLLPLNFCSSESIVREGVPDAISTSSNRLGYSIRRFSVCRLSRLYL